MTPVGFRLIDNRRTVASMIFMCNEIDVLRGVLPREPVKVSGISRLPNKASTPTPKQDPQPDSTWEARYPCFSVDQGRESLMKAMRLRDGHRLSELEYERIERRIRTALREQFNANDDAIVDLCRLARTMESE